LTLSGPLFVNRNKSPEAKQMTFFKIFNLLLHIYSSRRNFFVFNKISYLQPFREIMGKQRIRKFSAKMTPQAKKTIFFRIFFFFRTSTHQGATFLILSKFHLQPFREIMGGGQGKSVTSTTNNDELQRRTTTTNYIDDHKNPSGLSESSG